MRHSSFDVQIERVLKSM